jgi:hypothetical protein
MYVLRVETEPLQLNPNYICSTNFVKKFDIRIDMIAQLESVNPRYDRGVRWGFRVTLCGYEE